MKRKWWIRIIVGVLSSMSLIYGYLYLQIEREMVVYNTYSMRAGNYHEEYLTVIVNRLSVPNQMQCAEEIVQKCRDNDFKNVLFSYDYSIPNELQVTVYLSEQDVESGKKAFSFGYTQETKNLYEYNIVDHPEKFTIKIE